MPVTADNPYSGLLRIGVYDPATVMGAMVRQVYPAMPKGTASLQKPII